MLNANRRKSLIEFDCNQTDESCLTRNLVWNQQKVQFDLMNSTRN